MKLLLVLPILLATSACASQSETMVYQDLNYYKVDCKQKDQQIAFLRMQLRNTYDNNSRAIILHAMNETTTWCPAPKARPQGCVSVAETMPAGSASSTVCYQNGRERPVINRWEADVDH